MGFATALFALAASGIVATWAWLGAAVPMPSSAPGGGKLHCVSYAPFRGMQDPFGPDVPIDPRQIDEDLAQLRRITDCVRTYSVDHGLDRIAEIARRHGMKVVHGLWLSSVPELSRKQVETAVALAQRFPDVITAVIVGNEVLLRGEMAAPDLARLIREVKARVSVPVTYADVWEFWLKAPELAPAVDFVTIHILPYWEDEPVAATGAVAHVRDIREKVEEIFAGKEILIGEVGWPSQGRMRDGALPSPANQALVLSGVVEAAKAGGWKVNLIEAFDQPWKRMLEGTVGGYWGLFGDSERELKFRWGEPVSNYPRWQLAAALGIGAVFLVFATVWIARRKGAE